MKFTKTAVAVAIAGIASAPMIASADTTLSGIVEINLNGYDDEALPDNNSDGDAKFGAGDVNFNIKAEHELSSGLTGYGNIRVDLDRLSNDSTEIKDGNGTVIANAKSAGSADSIYTGIKGGFGDIRIGEIPLAIEYAQVANDIYDIGDEINGGISYTGNFGPVSVVGNFSPENNQDVAGIGGKFSMWGLNFGLGYEERADNKNSAAGLSFTYAGALIGVHYAKMENWSETNDEDGKIISAQVGYGMAGISGIVTYAKKETADTSSVEEESIRLDLGYAMGGGVDLSTRITQISDKIADNSDKTEWRIQLAKSF